MLNENITKRKEAVKRVEKRGKKNVFTFIHRRLQHERMKKKKRNELLEGLRGWKMFFFFLFPSQHNIFTSAGYNSEDDLVQAKTTSEMIYFFDLVSIQNSSRNYEKRNLDDSIKI